MFFPSPIHIRRKKTAPCPGALDGDYFLRLGYTEMKTFSVSPLPLSLSSLSPPSYRLQRSEGDPGQLLGAPKPLSYPRCPGQTHVCANMARCFSTGGKGAGMLPAPEGCYSKASVRLSCCHWPRLLRRDCFMQVQRSCSSTPPIP